MTDYIWLGDKRKQWSFTSLIYLSLWKERLGFFFAESQHKGPGWDLENSNIKAYNLLNRLSVNTAHFHHRRWGKHASQTLWSLGIQALIMGTLHFCRPNQLCLKRLIWYALLDRITSAVRPRRYRMMRTFRRVCPAVPVCRKQRAHGFDFELRNSLADDREWSCAAESIRRSQLVEVHAVRISL